MGTGSGTGGRIVSRDVLQYADTPTVGVATPTVGVATPPEGSYTDIPLTGMRKVRIGYSERVLMCV